MKKKIFLLAALVFLLNLFWEISHVSLYIPNLGISNFSILLLRATLGDLIIVSSIFIIITLKNKDWKWINKPSKVDYAIIISLSFISAILIELRALTQDRWFYTAAMPTIFGIGLTPLIQLAITSLVALWLVRN